MILKKEQLEKASEFINKNVNVYLLFWNASIFNRTKNIKELISVEKYHMVKNKYGFFTKLNKDVNYDPSQKTDGEEMKNKILLPSFRNVEVPLVVFISGMGSAESAFLHGVNTNNLTWYTNINNYTSAKDNFFGDFAIIIYKNKILDTRLMRFYKESKQNVYEFSIYGQFNFYVSIKDEFIHLGDKTFKIDEPRTMELFRILSVGGVK